MANGYAATAEKKWNRVKSLRYINKNREKLELLKKLANSTDFPIIVEGVKDEMVLTTFGFKNIFSISGRSDEVVVEMVCRKKPKSVSILTDFDYNGRKKFNRLSKLFQTHHIKIDNLLRKKLKEIMPIHKIEELSSLINLYNLEKF